MSYPDDPALQASTLALIGSIWRRVGPAIELARGWGVDWTEVSTPFVELVDDRVVAHVGVLELDVVLDGRPQKVAGVHAVCTAPDQRGRGHARRAMERALAWIDARYSTSMLWANDPAIYERFGFVARRESIFYAAMSGLGGSGAPVRPLSLDDPADVALLRDRLATRTPVSRWIGGADRGWLSLLDLALWSPRPSLAWIPDLDCVVVYGVRDRFLDLFDVIAEQIPPLEAIVGLLGPNLSNVVTYVGPDQLAAPQLVAERTSLIDQLMVRGAWPSGDQPFALSPIARC